MRKWKLGVVMLAIALLLGGSLGAYAATSGDHTKNPNSAADPGKTTEVAAGDTFRITLDSNPTTGYSWRAQYDETILELIDQTFEPDSDLLGAGGRETLVFKALAEGETTITAFYERPWEGVPIDTRTIDVDVSG